MRKSETGPLPGRGSRPDVSVWATTHGKRIRGKPGRRGHDRRDRLRSTRDLSAISGGSSGWALASRSRDADEPGLFEVPVEAESLVRPQIPHDHEARTVGQAPALVLMGLKQVEGGAEVAWVDPDRGDRGRGVDGAKELDGRLRIRFHPHGRRHLVEDETPHHNRTVDD